MIGLPIEMWHLIFDHLQLADLSSCAQVCKAVYLAVKAYRIREIAFTRGVHRWFHYTTPTIDHKHRVDFTMTSILKRSSFDFDHLKRLKIGQKSAIDLDVINRFTRLEELDIDLKNYKNEQNRTISLANLKVLYLFVPDDFSYVKLNTPSLTKVYTFRLKKLEFIYPESVRCIHMFFRGGKLTKFPNLEYLTLTDSYNQLDYQPSYNSQRFREFNIEALKKLKEIDFYYVFTNYRKNNMSNFKRFIASLLAVCQPEPNLFISVNVPDLKVFWHNVQVTDPNLLTEYEHMWETVRSPLAFQLQHYEKLKKDDFLCECRFQDLMRGLSKAGFTLNSEEFLFKCARYSFKRIHVFNKVEERELLLQLIARSPDLFDLIFWNSGLGQSFFDRMADTVRLKGIPLQLLYLGVNSVENFEFVTKLPDLESFKTEQQLPNELVRKLLRQPMLTRIEFTSGGITKRIKRLSSDGFILNWKFFSLQELLNHFDIKPDSSLHKSTGVDSAV